MPAGLDANGLQNNGGPLVGASGNSQPLLTIALLANSLAIDAGSNSLVPAGLTTDERGFNRIVNNTVDIGAYEFQPPATMTVIISSLNPSVLGQSVTFSASVTPLAPGSNGIQGNVTFLDNGTPLITVALTNGTGNFTTTGLAAGTHTITAEYVGFTLGDSHSAQARTRSFKS